jgi:hypothetical protein
MTLHAEQERVSVYKLTSPRMVGTVYIYYFDGQLAGLDFGLATLKPDQVEYLLAHTPVRSSELATVQIGQVTVKLLEPRSIQDKVIMFCQWFRRYRGVTYTAKILEKANLKGIPVNVELLDVFFNSPLANFTLSNYIQRINQTKDHLKNGAERQRARFPNEWSRETEAKYQGKDLEEYYQHLYRAGWRRESGPAGSVWKFHPELQPQ